MIDQSIHPKAHHAIDRHSFEGSYGNPQFGKKVRLSYLLHVPLSLLSFNIRIGSPQLQTTFPIWEKPKPSRKAKSFEFPLRRLRDSFALLLNSSESGSLLPDGPEKSAYAYLNPCKIFTFNGINWQPWSGLLFAFVKSAFSSSIERFRGHR